MNFQKLMLVFLFTVGVVFVEPQAMAATSCDGMQLVLDQVAIIDLNVDPIPALGFKVSRTPTTGTCDYFIVIDNGGGTSFNLRRLKFGSEPLTVPIGLYKEAGHSNYVKSVVQAANTNDIIFGTLSSSAEDHRFFYAQIDPYISVPVGTYTDSFSVSLYSWNGNNLNSKKFEQTKSSNFKFKKETTVDISLVDTGAPFNSLDLSQTLNFGLLSTGATLSFDIMLKYSSGYKLGMSSVNANRIKEVNSASYIPYSIMLDNVAMPVTLTATMQDIKTGSGTSPSLGTRLPMSVTIGDITGKPSGTYNDTVFISISSAN